MTFSATRIILFTIIWIIYYQFLRHSCDFFTNSPRSSPPPPPPPTHPHFSPGEYFNEIWYKTFSMAEMHLRKFSPTTCPWSTFNDLITVCFIEMYQIRRLVLIQVILSIKKIWWWCIPSSKHSEKEPLGVSHKWNIHQEWKEDIVWIGGGKCVDNSRCEWQKRREKPTPMILATPMERDKTPLSA